jgi:hypothetical protein
MQDILQSCSQTVCENNEDHGTPGEGYQIQTGAMDNNQSKPQDVGGTESEGGINQKYLTQDIIGPYSGIVYGRKGEKVKVIDDSQIMVLVEQESKRYFVRMENLVNVDQSVPLENNLPDEKDKEN